MHTLIRSHFVFFLVNSVFVINHILATGILTDHIRPNIFVLLCTGGASLFFCIIQFLFSQERIIGKDLLTVAICALFGVAGNQLFFFNGLSLSSFIDAELILVVHPICVIILSYFLLKEKITLRISLGVIAGAIGSALLTFTSIVGSGDSFLGNFFFLLSAASYAIFLVLLKPLLKRYKPFTVITYVFSFGFLYVLFYPPTLIEIAKTNFAQVPNVIILKIIFIQGLLQFFAYFLTAFGLKFLSASVSSSYMYLQPVLVTIFTFIFSMLGISEDFTDTVNWEKVGYMLVIFLGVLLVSSASFRKSKP